MSELRRRLRVLFRRERFDRDLEEEMQAHLEMQADENREAGMDAGEARYAAKRQFGNVTLLREQSRDAWGWSWLDTLVQDVRFAARMMRRNAAFTTIAVLTLALGIGANTAVFSLVEAVVLRPLPYPEPERLFMLWTVEGRSQRAMNSSYPDFRDWREQSELFEGMAAFHGGSFNLTGEPEPERVNALHATPGVFEVLGIQPMLGRTFAKGEDDERVVLLDHRLWMRRFGGNPNIVGQIIRLDGRAYSVLGVVPPGFRFVPRHFVGDHPELFVPLAPYADRTSWSLRVIGRLKRGVSQQQAQAEMDAIAARLAQAYPVAIDRRQGIKVQALREHVISGTRPTALLLLGAVSFVLLIACANVANLLLSQGAVRQREIAIRLAIGANRGRLVRQLLTESVLLAGLGGALGILLAYCCLPLLTAVAPAGTALLTRVQDTGIQLNSTVLAFTSALAVLAGILCGVLPAWKSTQPVTSSVRSSRSPRLRGGLIALEVALSFVLLAGAGLMMKTLVRLLAVDLGFSTERLLTMYTSLPRSKYPDSQAKNAFFRQVLKRLETLPAVVSVGGVVDLPLTRAYSVNPFEIEGNPPRQGRAGYHAVSPGYFQTMGIPLLRGRFFMDGDSELAPSVGIVNRTMARRYWPDEDPIGKGVLVGRDIIERTVEGTLRFVKQRVEIVGIVGDVRHFGLDADTLAELFMPYPQHASGKMTLVVRTAADPASLIPLVRKEIWRADPDQPVTDIKTMQEWVSADTAPRRFVLLLIGVFALAAVALAAAGIYGVISYSVAQRTQEIGIRLALGAERRTVIWWVLRQTMFWLAAGLVVGTAGAAALTRLLVRYLFGVEPTDPAVFILVAVVLVLVALSANAVPAGRASRVDPAEALRYE